MGRDRQVLPDAVDRGDHPFVVGRHEADHGQLQQGGVNLIGVEMHREVAVAHTAPLDRAADRGARLSPAFEIWGWEAELVGETDPTVDGHPQHALECTKWRGGPRNSQMPWSGPCQTSQAQSTQARRNIHSASSMGVCERCHDARAQRSARTCRAEPGRMRRCPRGPAATPGYPARSSSRSGSQRRPSTPYMMCRSAALPAAVRIRKSRNPCPTSLWPARSIAASTSVESRIQA